MFAENLFGHGDDGINSLNFIENKGQWDADIKFRMEIPNGYMFFHDGGLTYLFYHDPKAINHLETVGTNLRNHSGLPNDIDLHAVRITFDGGNGSTPKPESNPGREVYNYFLGNDAKKWASQVKSYKSLIYENAFDGVDIIFYSHDQLLKYDLIIKHGANTSLIKLLIEGADELNLDSEGLKISTSLQSIREQNPFSYQKDGAGNKNAVSSNFILNDDALSFEIGPYDTSKNLIIDPALVFSTFSGSTADNWGFTATYDDAGNAYTGGIVHIIPGVGGTLPVTFGAYSIAHNGGVWDISLLKYDSTGTNLIYGTYLGGSNNEFPHSLVVNNAGELLIMGSTGSQNFPTHQNAYNKTFSRGPSVDPLDNGALIFTPGSDIFISKLSANGSQLLSSTFLGGTNTDGVGVLGQDLLVKNYGDQFRGDIITDDNDNIYIASNTNSANYPIKGGLQSYGGGNRDAVITKFDPDLTSIIWSTFLGGSGEDVAYSIKLFENGNVIVAGGTTSNDFPIAPLGENQVPKGGIDGFTAIISADGRLLLSNTYLGTNADDQAFFVDLDTYENVYILGQTRGFYPWVATKDYPIGAGQFIHKLTPDLGSTLLSTVFGAPSISSDGEVIPNISPTAFLVNECNQIYISGWGSSLIGSGSYQGMSPENMPVTNDAFQTDSNNGAFYMTAFTEDLSELLFATYFGGTVASAHVDGGTSRFDKRGIVYQSVCSCGGAADNFPTTPGAWSETNKSNPVPNGSGGFFPRCNNAVFKFDLATLKSRILTNTVEGDEPGIRDVCIPNAIVFINGSNGGETIQWGFGDGTIVDDMDTVVHQYQNPGVYSVFLKVEDPNTCQQVDVSFASIRVEERFFSVMVDTAICEGTLIELMATGADSYIWNSDKEPTIFINDPNPLVSPKTTTRYALEASTVGGCLWRDTVEIRVVPKVISEFTFEKDYECMDFPTFSLTNKSTNEELLIWNFGDGSASNEENPIYKYASNGTFNISLGTQLEFCFDLKSEEIRSDLLFLPNVITPNDDGANDFFYIPNDGGAELSIVNRNGDVVLHSSDYQNNWDAKNFSDGVYYYNLTMPDSTECKGILHVLR